MPICPAREHDKSQIVRKPGEGGMTMTRLVKDQGTRIEYEFDWSAAYPAGQAIIESGWTVAPDETGGIVVAAAAHDLLHATATLTGRIVGHVYRVTNRVTLREGQLDERAKRLRGIGRGEGRDRVGADREISGVAGSVTKKLKPTDN